ncbi:LytR/AlgR family response regulator transcription factor [Flavihumibacter profundi]|uniref:LytR/AlgR family response regulator transcription factor n=1 Tax=Flavihumibacter profundi TaxID=2716883 RepID=UPI001CC6E9E9|nr:LytTR family DNA-binding domain-containing protein [Flavihumibacter profundi]MBZ5857256.1 LytTR family DNA-binding domain-containing protein [Flavihumibacter profundi]
MLKAIVLDDEPLALEVVKSMTEKVSFVDVLAYFANAFEAMDFLKKNPVDLVFLDIKMPDITGIDFLKSLANPPMVIFTTAYSEHAVESFELDAIDYLLKPFSMVRFLKACNKAYEADGRRARQTEENKKPDYIFIKSGYEQIRILLADILYAEGSGNYVQFVLDNKKIASRLTMGEAEEILPKSAFIRIHRSYIVAKQHIQKIDRKSVWTNITELPIGPAYLTEIEKITR